MRYFENKFFLGRFLAIFAIFFLIIMMEFFTPNDYVFGYLYAIPILLTNYWFGRFATVQAIAFSVALIMLNLWLPAGEIIQLSTVANRGIAAMSLIMTGILIDRIRTSKDAILQQQTKLETQEQLVRVREDFVSTLTHDLKTPL